MRKVKVQLSSACGRRGSQLGRINTMPYDVTAPIKLTLVRLRWVDGDYDSGGAYWGGICGHIYRAAGHDAKGNRVEIFVRAWSRLGAKEKVQIQLPHVSFIRSRKEKNAAQ